MSSALLPQLAAATRAAAASTPTLSAGRVRRRAERDAQFRAEMAHVQQYICAQAGELDEEDAGLLGVHDTRSRSYYDEIQLFLERKQQLEHHEREHGRERVLLRGLDEYLNELDPSLFAEGATPSTPQAGMAVADLPPSSSYIRRKQEEAMLARLWHKYQSMEAERCSGNASLSCESSFKRQRVM